MITFIFSAILFTFIIAACSFVALSTVTTFATGHFIVFIATLKVAMFILPLLIIFTMFFGALWYHPINALVYSIVIFWVPILIYLFLSSIILIAIVFIATAVGVVLPLHFLLLATIIFIALCILVGIMRALSPQVIHYALSVPKLAPLWNGKKIILISDVHLGMVRREKFLEKIVHLINAESPDLVIIAGDLLDGPVIHYEHVLKPLGKIKSTFGVYYTAGNHDEYNRDQNAYQQELSKYVTVLNDARMTVNETEIVGLVYAQEKNKATKNRLMKIGYEDNGQPSIAILHDPKNAHALADAGVSLIVSGHTHSGQFFPISLFVKALYKERARGKYKIKDTVGFTSVGVGTAAPLFRLGTQPEIAVLKITE